MSSTPLKIMIHSMDGAGHINASIGFAQAMASRGHYITFVMNKVHRGKFAALGFDEICLTRKGSKEVEQQPNVNLIKVTAKQLVQNGLLSGVSSFEKMKGHNAGENNFLATLCDKLADFDEQIEEAIHQVSPDVIVVNQFLTPPAILRANVPWIYQYPCNSLGLYKSDKLPPFYSGKYIHLVILQNYCSNQIPFFPPGYPVKSNPSTWTEYRQYLDTEYVERFNRYQRELNYRCNYQPVEGELEKRAENANYFAKSPHLNIYDCFQELDYNDIAPRPENCVPFDAFFRKNPKEMPFELPKGFVKPGDKLIYVSMGSMGGIDLELMKRIVSALGSTPHKYIISKGLRSDEYTLPPNCWGQDYLPQTRILPLVDLVITHGGNNTVTETFSFGKPMIVLAWNLMSLLPVN